MTETSSAANTVDIFGNAIVLSRREIIVDDMLDVGDIKTASRDTSGNKQRAATLFERTPGRLSVLSKHRERSIVLAAR